MPSTQLSAEAILEVTNPVLSTYLSKHGDVLYPILKKHMQQHQEDPDFPQSRWERAMQAGFLMKCISKRSIIDSCWEGLTPEEYRLVCRHQVALDQERAKAKFLAELRDAAAGLGGVDLPVWPVTPPRKAVSAARKAVAAPKRRAAAAPKRRAAAAPKPAGQTVQNRTADKASHPARNGERISQRDRRPTRHFDEISASSSPEAPSPRARSGPVRPTDIRNRRPRFNRAALAAPPEQPSPAVMTSVEDVDSSIEEQTPHSTPVTSQDSLLPPPKSREPHRIDGPNCTSPINKFGWRLFRYFRHHEDSLTVQEILNEDIFRVGRDITNGPNALLNHPLSAAEQQYLAGEKINYTTPSQIARYRVGKYQTALAMAIYCEHNLRLIARSQAAGENKAFTLNWKPATIQLFCNMDTSRFTTFFKMREDTHIFPPMFVDARQQAIAPAMTARVPAAVRREVYEQFMAWEDEDEVSNGVGNGKVCIRQ